MKLIINLIIIKKYQLELPPQLEFLSDCKGTGALQLLSEEDIFKFIEDMSSLNLINEKNKFNNRKEPKKISI